MPNNPISLETISKINWFRLRSISYDDKNISTTRNIFAILLILCFIGTFCGLLAYKLVNVPTSGYEVLPKSGQRTISYERYQELSKDVEIRDTLVCSTTRRVHWRDIVPVNLTDILYQSYEWCNQTYMDTNDMFNMEIESCCNGAWGSRIVLAKHPIYTTFFPDMETLNGSLYDECFLEWIKQSDTEWAGRIYSQDGLKHLHSINGIAVPNEANFELYDRKVTEYLEGLVDGAYIDVTIAGGQHYYDLVGFNEISYQKYFELSSITRCSYTQPIGGLDIVSFAFTTTSSFFSGFTFIAIGAYHLTKYIQHNRGKNNGDSSDSSKSSDADLAVVSTSS